MRYAAVYNSTAWQAAFGDEIERKPRMSLKFRSKEQKQIQQGRRLELCTL
jgi:hypothetical protein